VQNVFPSLVSEDVNTHYFKLDYQGLAAPMVKAIQQLNLKLEDLATTTATSTDTSFTTRFFSSLFSRITSWLADAQNGITDFFAQIIHASEGHFAKEVCVGKSDGTEVCASGD
jgi:hypothetical protein